MEPLGSRMAGAGEQEARGALAPDGRRLAVTMDIGMVDEHAWAKLVGDAGDVEISVIAAAEHVSGDDRGLKPTHRPAGDHAERPHEREEPGSRAGSGVHHDPGEGRGGRFIKTSGAE